MTTDQPTAEPTPRPKQIKIETGAGTVTIGRLSFDGYRSVKDAVIDALSESLTDTLGTILGGPFALALQERLGAYLEARKAAREAGQPEPQWDVEGTMQIAPLLVEQLRGEVRSVCQQLLSRIDFVTEDFVRGCIAEPDFDPAKLDAFEFLELRDAAWKINDLARLVELEKNFWAGALDKLKAIAGSIRQQ